MIEFIIMPKTLTMKFLRAFAFVSLTIVSVLSVFTGNDVNFTRASFLLGGYLLSIIVILCKKPHLKGVLVAIVLELLSTQVVTLVLFKMQKD